MYYLKISFFILYIHDANIIFKNDQFSNLINYVFFMIKYLFRVKLFCSDRKPIN